MTDVPLVSVIMPTRNRAAIVPRAIASVVAQTMTAWELIIIDDASTDATADVVALCASADPRMRHLRVEAPRGAAAARNQGIDAARAGLIAFIDDDDEWDAARLQRQYDVLVAAPQDAGLVHSAFLEVAVDGSSHRAGSFSAAGGNALDSLVRGNQLGHSTVLVRKDLLLAAGGFDERLPRLQDWDLWLRLAAITRFLHVAEPLVRVHHTPASISTNRTALIEACTLMAAKYRETPMLSRRRYADLCYALGQLLVRTGLPAHARGFIVRSLRLRAWPPTRVAGALLLLVSGRSYYAVADALARVSAPRVP